VVAEPITEANSRCAMTGGDGTEGEHEVVTPLEVTTAQQRLRALQWVTPAPVAVIIALGARQREQHCPHQITKGVGKKLTRPGLTW
jgi:hypothetical protein